MNQVCKITPFFLLLLIGCTAHKTTFIPVQPSAEKGAALYVYRSSEVSSLMLAPVINIKEVDGGQTKIGRLGHGEYKLVYLLPGNYEIQLESIDYYAPGNSLAIEVKPETVNYLRLDTSLSFETGLRYKSYERKLDLQEVDEVIALSEMSSCVDIDSKPKKKKRSLEKTVEDISGQNEDARFSTDKTTDPFSRRQ